ncbi:MAG: DUF2089 domain-containing protein [Tissierellales bacterium]|jgi:hypothetical protein|nr:DUF2089 domain-containing protein [Tissierellales bacterium]MBN2828216.1 DUF2089 domain-containing protein [Tissierellales bacterium]
MIKEVLGICPVCESKLKVTQLSCKKCGTVISGEFELCKFCQLQKEQKYFAEIFIKNRGNIKEIEKELGISYPTVRRLLDEVIEALGYKEEAKKDVVNQGEILDRLSRGDITSEQAFKLLNGENI